MVPSPPFYFLCGYRHQVERAYHISICSLLIFFRLEPPTFQALGQALGVKDGVEGTCADSTPRWRYCGAAGSAAPLWCSALVGSSAQKRLPTRAAILTEC